MAAPLFQFMSRHLQLSHLIGWSVDGASISSFTLQPHTLPTIRTKYDADLSYDGKPDHHPAAAMAMAPLHGTHLGKIDNKLFTIAIAAASCRCGGLDGDVSTKMY